MRKGIDNEENEDSDRSYVNKEPRLEENQNHPTYSIAPYHSKSSSHHENVDRVHESQHQGRPDGKRPEEVNGRWNERDCSNHEPSVKSAAHHTRFLSSSIGNLTPMVGVIS